MLLALVATYEAKRWPIDIDESFDPIEELGHTQAELAEILLLALARIGNSVAPTRAHRRYDP